jgi:methionyl-tRNA formyltransferase
MGTPEFAVAPLKTLLENNYNIKAVVTATDKPAGRGKKIQFSDVKKFAIENNLTILQPQNLKSDEFVEEIKKLEADLFIVVAFRMLPEKVWKIPNLGTFNLHASLLPDYRGAAPINHCIINGDTKSGVTTFFINDEIDTGTIILQESVKIAPIDNAGSLHDKLMITGAELVLKTVKLIEDDKLKLVNQTDLITNELRYAPKIFKDDCRINWNKSGEKINNFIRGLSPYPSAWTIFKPNSETITIKIYSVNFIAENHNLKNGKIISDNKSYIKIAVANGNGFINLLELQMQGKKLLKVKDFLNGFKFEEDSIFE